MLPERLRGLPADEILETIQYLRRIPNLPRAASCICRDYGV